MTLTELEAKQRQHHWSGWPGAFCLKCGAEDPREIGLADDWYDEEMKPRTQEIAKRIDAALVCPVVGELVWNSETKKWDLHK